MILSHLPFFPLSFLLYTTTPHTEATQNVLLAMDPPIPFDLVIFLDFQIHLIQARRNRYLSFERFVLYSRYRYEYVGSLSVCSIDIVQDA